MPNSSSDRLLFRKGNSQDSISIFNYAYEFKAHDESQAALAIDRFVRAVCDVVTADDHEFYVKCVYYLKRISSVILVLFDHHIGNL